MARPITAVARMRIPEIKTDGCRRAHFAARSQGVGRLGLDRLVLQEPPQVVGQLLRRGVAALGLLGHRLQDDRLQVAGDRRVDASRWRRARRTAICRSSSWRSWPSKAGRSVSSSYRVAPSE